MKLPGRHLSVLTVATAVAVLALGAPLASPPSAEAFGSLPEIDQVRLSPSGEYCVALRNVSGKPYLAVIDVSAEPDEAIKFIELEVMENIEEKIGRIHWLNDDMIGITLEFEANRLGVPTTETRLIALSRDLTRGTTIPAPLRGALFNTQLAHRILDYLPEDPDHVLMALDRKAGDSELSVYEVNVETGAVARVLYGDEFVAGYLVDQQGRVRLRREIRDEKVRIRVSGVNRSNWRTLWEGTRSAGMEFYPLAFAENPDVMLVLKQGASGVDEVFEFRIDERVLGERLFAHPEVDVIGLETDPYTRQVIGAHYAVHYPIVHYFDEEFDQVQKLIDGALPDSRNHIESFDRARERFIVFATGPDLPGSYYLFKKKKLELHPIGETYTALDWDALRPVEPVTYEARDGLTIPSYLTRPTGKPPFPMVVLPHGGPVARDYQRFDYMAQFLASRGYAVLQPNFRGSAGYGASFLAAGMKQWGLAMQDDLEDGTRAMIDRGIADPERICIVGWSYGGYAALMGAVRTPKLFACAVAGAAVTDIPRMLKEDSRYKFMSQNRPSVGHYRKDRDSLRDNSPINNVDVIQIPILLVHGDNDRVVPYRHSKKMAAKLNKDKKPHALVTLEDGNHHLSLEQNRIRFLKELESFLAEHLSDDRGAEGQQE